MKSLKSLLTLAIAMAVSSTAFAENTNPLTTLKSTAQDSVQTLKTESKSAVKNQMTNAKETLSSAKNAAKEKMTSSASSKTELKTAVSEKVESVKKSAKTKAENVKTAATQKININTADAKTLQSLSGIGEAKAKAIVEYRNKVGKFKSINELSNVSGIGSSTLEKISPLLSL